VIRPETPGLFKPNCNKQSGDFKAIPFTFMIAGASWLMHVAQSSTLLIAIGIVGFVVCYLMSKISLFTRLPAICDLPMLETFILFCSCFLDF
jgi:hypothetical protein